MTAILPITADSARNTVTAIWGEDLTEILNDFLEQRAQSGRAPRIVKLYDLLSEALYQSTIRWERITSVEQFHRIFRDISGPDVLTPLGDIVGEDVQRFAPGPTAYKTGWYHEDDIPTFGFEARIGANPDALREDDPMETQKRLLCEQPWLEGLSGSLQYEVVLAEHSWRKVEALPQFSWAGLVNSFVRPVEATLRDKVGPATRMMLGELIQEAENRLLYPPTEIAKLRELNDLWRRAKRIQPGQRIDRHAANKARALAFEVLGFLTGGRVQKP